MNKIMFNDKYGLTKAVLEGRKTQTRRIIPVDIINGIDTLCLLDFNKKHLKEEDKDYNCYQNSDGDFIDARLLGRYMVGEEVAIAQSYKDSGYTKDLYQTTYLRKPTIVKSIDSEPLQGWVDMPFDELKGWNNKMFVRADLMPHRIKITNICIERLQDIKHHWTDALREGVTLDMDAPVGEQFYIEENGVKVFYLSAIGAFASLIDKTCGKGTWNRNPYVFVYDFELV